MSAKYDDTLIIVPAYNEGSVIEDNLNKILKEFKHVVCVNDGSSDNTAEEVSKTRAILLSHPVNIGPGGASQTGIEYGIANNFNFFATFDANGQHSLKDLKEMVDLMHKNKNIDIMIGSRFLSKKAKNMPFSKKILLKIAIIFSNITSRVKATDTHNGLRAFNLKTAKKLDLKLNDYSHASEILDKIRINKLNFQEFPTTVYYTDYSKGKGQSSINAVNIMVDQLLNMLRGKK